MRAGALAHGAALPSPVLPSTPGIAAAGAFRTAAQKRYSPPTHVAGPGLPLTSRPGGRCDAIDREVLIGHEGLPPIPGLSIYRLTAQSW